MSNENKSDAKNVAERGETTVNADRIAIAVLEASAAGTSYPHLAALIERLATMEPDARGLRAVALGLARKLGTDADPSNEDLLAPFAAAAAVLLDAQNRIGAINSAGVESFALEPGAALRDLPLTPGALERIEAQIALARAEGGAHKDEDSHQLLRCEALDGREIGVHVICRRHMVLLVTTEPAWQPELITAIRTHFSLSSAEIEVLRGLVECRSAKDIAALRRRSLDTVRSQIRAILAKTKTHTQTELVRLVLSLQMVVAAR